MGSAKAKEVLQQYNKIQIKRTYWKRGTVSEVGRICWPSDLKYMISLRYRKERTVGEARTRIWSPWDQNLTSFLSYWRYRKEDLDTKFVILVQICRCLYINHWKNTYESLSIHLAKLIVLCPKKGHVYNRELTKMMPSKTVEMRRLWHGLRQSFCCLSSPRKGARTKIHDIRSKFMKQKQCLDTVQWTWKLEGANI